MAEITFPCVSCHKNIQCDESWIGQQINCPMCNAQFTVPKEPKKQTNPLVPKPTASAGGAKLASGATSVARPSFGAGIPIRNNPTNRAKKKNPALTYGAVALVVAAVGFLGYMYGWPAYTKWKEERAAANAPPPPPPQEQPAEPPPPTNQPPVAPKYTLDAAQAVIPAGKVNGQISGTNFLMDAVRLDRTPTSSILTIREGAGASPDRGVMVYMRLAPGETLTNKTFTVNATDRPGQITQVTKVWKTNPRYAATTKPFTTGYALKLEFGAMAEDGSVPGKIFLAFPDKEESVVGGAFTVGTTTPVPGQEAVQIQQTTPQDAEAQRRFQQRYGVRR